MSFYFRTLIVLFFITGVSYADKISNQFISKLTNVTENKLEFFINDMFSNVEFGLSGLDKGKPEYSLNTIVPILDKDEQSLFFQGNFSTQSDIETLNLGIGQRNLLMDNTILIGVNAFYDLDLSNSHERWGMGTDLLTSVGDIHVNYYEAITDFKFDKYGNKEITLDGFDVALGFPVPYMPNSKLYFETFFWNGVNGSSDLKGETYSLRNSFPYGINLEFGKISYDKLNTDQKFIKFNINLFELNRHHKPLKSEILSMISSEPFSMEFSDVSERRFEKVKRENKIKKQTNRNGIVKIMGY